MRLPLMWSVHPGPTSGIARERCRAASWVLLDLAAALFVMSFVVAPVVGAIVTGVGWVSDETWQLLAGGPTRSVGIAVGALLLGGLYLSHLGDRFERRRRRIAADLEEDDRA